MLEINKKPKNLINTPVIILVEPQLPENIGMVARAMANFNLSKLRLVKPREPFPNKKARAAASKAGYIIDDTLIFNTLQDAIADLNYVFATTARKRCSFKNVKSAVEAASTLYHRAIIGDKTGVLFGRERWGLRNDEISLSDEIITFPVNPACSSLNIAQAVLLISYEWMKSGLHNFHDTAFRSEELKQASKATLHGFLSQLEDALEIRGYFRPKERKKVMITNIRSIFTRANFSESEIRLLRGVIASLDRFFPQFSRNTEVKISSDHKKIDDLCEHQ